MVYEGGILPDECAYSSITRMELLGFPEIDAEQEQAIVSMLSAMHHLPIDRKVEDAAIQLRRATRLKLPDVIIAATAKVHGLDLLSLDRALCAVLLRA